MYITFRSYIKTSDGLPPFGPAFSMIVNGMFVIYREVRYIYLTKLLCVNISWILPKRRAECICEMLMSYHNCTDVNAIYICYKVGLLLLNKREDLHMFHLSSDKAQCIKPCKSSIVQIFYIYTVL